MVIASIFDAKTNLSKYIAAILDKMEPFVVISRNGKPVAKIVPYEEEKTKRIGADCRRTFDKGFLNHLCH